MKKINSSNIPMDEDVISPPPSAEESKQRTSSFVYRLTRNMTALLLALVFLTGGMALYFYRQLSTLESNPQVQAQKETADLIAQISKIFLLPGGETPTVATVLDPAGLKSQAFFLNAAKGDKVLIYANAREAILYDPSVGKIINVAPLVTGNSQSSSALSPGNPPSVSLAPASSTSENSSSTKMQK